MGTSYLYLDCGCEFNVEDDDWNCDKLCKKHKDKLCDEDLNKENY